MTDYTDAALDAVRRGLGVLPAAANAKRPTGRYRDTPALRTEDEVHAREWPHGVCVMLDGRHYVLDADEPDAARSLRPRNPTGTYLAWRPRLLP